MLPEDVILEVEWDPKKDKEVSSMRSLFTTLTWEKKGVFHSVKDGTPGSQLKEFDPMLGKMALLPMPTRWSRLREETA